MNITQRRLSILVCLLLLLLTTTTTTTVSAFTQLIQNEKKRSFGFSSSSSRRRHTVDTFTTTSQHLKKYKKSIIVVYNSDDTSISNNSQQYQPSRGRKGNGNGKGKGKGGRNEREMKKRNKVNNTNRIHRDADTIFSIIDADGNGSISQKELLDHLTIAGYTPAVVNSIFHKLDTNRDGKLSKQEFRNGFVYFTSLRSAKGLGNYHSEFEKDIYQTADIVFDNVDVDGNGTIDIIELRSYLYDSPLSKKAVRNIFNMLDVNHDGTISKEELRDSFVRCSALRLCIGNSNNNKQS